MGHLPFRKTPLKRYCLTLMQCWCLRGNNYDVVAVLRLKQRLSTILKKNHSAHDILRSYPQKGYYLWRSLRCTASSRFGCLAYLCLTPDRRAHTCDIHFYLLQMCPKARMSQPLVIGDTRPAARAGEVSIHILLSIFHLLIRCLHGLLPP